MNFKAPRCKDTDPQLRKIRDIAPSENLRCEVGMGECSELAVESQDNGEGGEFLLCKQHLVEFKHFAQLVAEMTPNQITKLEQAIDRASRD